MKPHVALIASALLVAAACSESALPTQTHLGLQPHFEIGLQQGGCPTPFTLASSIKQLSQEIEEADANGDGFACYLVTHVTETEVFRTWTDNNTPFTQIAGCPNEFDFVRIDFETTGHSTDANGDGWICTRVSGNGSTIEIDNNHRTRGT